MNQVLANKKNLLAKKLTKQLPKQTLIAMREFFSGPLPHPNILIKYEEIQKGAAHRIIKMAERQSGHRQAMEKKVIESNVCNERIGMVLSFIINILIITGAVYLIKCDKQITGLITLIGALGIQIYNSYAQQLREKEVQQKEVKK